MSPKHPAKFSKVIIEQLKGITAPYNGLLLDGFAGTGKIHELARPGLETWGIEIEPEWASMHARTIVGNALTLPFPDSTFSIYCTSPTYGNRLADHHVAKDDSVRHSYTHDLGRPLHYSNTGKMHYGSDYEFFHAIAWEEAYRVLKPGGIMIVNVSNFIRKGEVVDVVKFHKLALAGLFRQGREILVQTPRLRYGANFKVRVETESILVTTKEAV